MPVPTDDDVVMHCDPKRPRDLHDLPRHLDVGTRRCRIASGMIVHQTSKSTKVLMSVNFLAAHTTTGAVDWGR